MTALVIISIESKLTWHHNEKRRVDLMSAGPEVFSPLTLICGPLRNFVPSSAAAAFEYVSQTL